MLCPTSSNNNITTAIGGASGGGGRRGGIVVGVVGGTTICRRMGEKTEWLIGQKVKSKWIRQYTNTNKFSHVDIDTWIDMQEKYICEQCDRELPNPNALRLHKNTHLIERSFRCEPCGVSFRTKGHLQKHRRSTAHENKVTMSQVFGMPTSDNPRPYKCKECDISFRIHGHLAKHLRSKMHIMKMESNGYIPKGFYAEIERSGMIIKDLMDTTDCEQSLKSLQSIASTLPHLLLDNDPQQQPNSSADS